MCVHSAARPPPGWLQSPWRAGRRRGGHLLRRQRSVLAGVDQFRCPPGRLASRWQTLLDFGRAARPIRRITRLVSIRSARFIIGSLIDGLCQMRQASQFGRTRPVS
jgi:hypothetical protein